MKRIKQFMLDSICCIGIIIVVLCLAFWMAGMCDGAECQTCGGQRVIGTGPVKTSCPVCLGSGEVATAPVFSGAEHPGHRQAVVRIVNHVNDGGRTRGSGVLVEPSLVLTAWHVVDEGPGITVTFADGVECKGEVVAKDEAFDLATVRVEPGRAVPVPVAEATPGLRQEVTLAGFGPGEYREINGQVNGRWRPPGRNPMDRISVTGSARQGDSGGPMISNGKVVGIISTANGYQTWGSHSGRIRRLLGMPDATPARGSVQDCPTGTCPLR